MEIVIVGKGNVGSHLAKALKVKAYGRKDVLPTDADVYIIAVPDYAIHSAGLSIRQSAPQAVIIHTSATTPMLQDGVLYPLQTFTKGQKLDYSAISIFIEAANAKSLNVIADIATRISSHVYYAKTAQREQLHLAAVFACNFTNHLQHIARECIPAGMPDEVLSPLLKETVRKLESLTPEKAQTGPAIRRDQVTIERHIALLRETHPQYTELYRLFTQDIQSVGNPYPPMISKEQMKLLPSAVYAGDIHNITTSKDLAEAIQHIQGQHVVGIDTESRAVFRKGQRNRISLLQLATPDNQAYLVYLQKIEDLTPLQTLFEDVETIKIGLSLKDDIRELQTVVPFCPQAFEEIQQLAPSIGIADKSLQKIYAILFGTVISKSQQLSNWEAYPLSKAQQHYAALDAAATLQIYTHINAKHADKLSTYHTPSRQG